MKKTTKKIIRVAFFGDAMVKKTDDTYLVAVETASLLAGRGNYIIVNGGGPGIMGAATEGAKKVGGKVELVIMNPKKEPDNYEGSDKNSLEYASKIYKVDSYEKRLSKLIDIADAFVIFKGGSGTLSEVGMVWEMAKFEYGYHEPLIFVGKEWGKVVKSITENMGFENIEKRVVVTVETAEEVLRALARVGPPRRAGS